MTLTVVPFTSPVSLKARRAARRIDFLRASAGSLRTGGALFTVSRERFTASTVPCHRLPPNGLSDYPEYKILCQASSGDARGRSQEQHRRYPTFRPSLRRASRGARCGGSAATPLLRGWSDERH